MAIAWEPSKSFTASRKASVISFPANRYFSIRSGMIFVSVVTSGAIDIPTVSRSSRNAA